jgi:hypothetical protein
LAIREIAINTTDCNVHNKIELLVEGRIVGLSLPRVILGWWETTLFPEALSWHIDIKNNVILSVNVGEETIGGPQEAVDVHSVSKGFSVLVLSVCQRIFVLIPGGAPVKSWSKGVLTASRATSWVTTRLHDINFARSRPCAVGLISWEKPNSRPNPVTFGELSSDLNSSISEAEGLSGSYSGAWDGVDVVATTSCTSFATIECVACALISGSTAPNVVSTSHHCLFPNEFWGKGWLEVELTILDKWVSSVVVVEFELPVTTATHGDLVFPGLEVELVEIVRENECLSGSDTDDGDKSFKHLIIISWDEVSNTIFRHLK